MTAADGTADSDAVAPTADAAVASAAASAASGGGTAEARAVLAARIASLDREWAAGGPAAHRHAATGAADADAGGLSSAGRLPRPARTLTQMNQVGQGM
jgi:hypothetical protein